MNDTRPDMSRDQAHALVAQIVAKGMRRLAALRAEQATAAVTRKGRKA